MRKLSNKIIISSDEEQKDFHEIEKIPPSSIYQYPTFRSKNMQGDITIGDLHGNFMLLIHWLVVSGIVLIKPENYHQLAGCYLQAPLSIDEFEPEEKSFENYCLLDREKGLYSLTSAPISIIGKDFIDCSTLSPEDAISLFKETLDTITVNERAPKRLLRILGDELADRGRNDFFTIHLLAKMKDLGVPYEILLSNHAVMFQRRSEDLKKLGNRYDYRSRLALDKLFDQNLVTREEIQNLLDKAYYPNLKLLSYSISPTTLNMTVYSHAPTDLRVVKGLAKYFNTLFESSNLLALCQSIDRINQAFSENREVVIDETLRGLVNGADEQNESLVSLVSRRYDYYDDLVKGNNPLFDSKRSKIYQRDFMKKGGTPANAKTMYLKRWLMSFAVYQGNVSFVHGHCGQEPCSFFTELGGYTNLDSYRGRHFTSNQLTDHISTFREHSEVFESQVLVSSQLSDLTHVVRNVVEDIVAQKQWRIPLWSSPQQQLMQFYNLHTAAQYVAEMSTRTNKSLDSFGTGDGLLSTIQLIQSYQHRIEIDVADGSRESLYNMMDHVVTGVFKEEMSSEQCNRALVQRMIFLLPFLEVVRQAGSSASNNFFTLRSELTTLFLNYLIEKDISGITDSSEFKRVTGEIKDEAMERQVSRLATWCRFSFNKLQDEASIVEVCHSSASCGH